MALTPFDIPLLNVFMQNAFGESGLKCPAGLSTMHDFVKATPSSPLCSVLLCVVQNGTEGYDLLEGVVVDDTGRLLMAGIATGGWNGSHRGNGDFVAVLFGAQSTLPPTPSPTIPPSYAAPPGLWASPSSITPGPTGLPLTHSPTPFSSTATLPLTTPPSSTGSSGLSPTPSPTFSPSVGPAGHSYSTATIAVVVASAVAMVAVLLAVCLWRKIARLKYEARHLSREMHTSQMSRSPAVELSKSVILPKDNSYGSNIVIAAPPALPENALELEKPAASAGRVDLTKVIKVDGQDYVKSEEGTMLTTSTMATSMTSVALSSGPLHGNTSIDITSETTISESESAIANVAVSRNSTGSVLTGVVGISAAVAVMEAASAVASSSSIPGVSEAASLVSVLVKLVVDKKDNDITGDWRVRWCRSIVAVLERASELIEKVSEISAQMRRLSNAKYSLKTVFLSRRMNAF